MALALLVTGCGENMEYAFISQTIPSPPQYSIGEIVYVRSVFCRGRIVNRQYDVYLVSPVLCADNSVYYNVTVNGYELSR